jgi:cell division protein FtsW (lipid II flippase)
MGTTADWAKLIFLALGFAGFSAVSLARTRWTSDLRSRPYLLFMEILFCTANGLLFAIFVRFDGRAFRQPLVFVVCPLLIAVLGFALLTYQQRQQARK